MARPWNFGWPLGPARGGAASRRGNAGLERQRHVGDGNEPSRQHFVQICDEAESDLRELLSLPADYAVMFMQGGGSGKTPLFP